jgi:hypothetical protein
MYIYRGICIYIYIYDNEYTQVFGRSDFTFCTFIVYAIPITHSVIRAVQGQRVEECVLPKIG